MIPYIIGYCIVALLFTVIFIDDIDDGDDVGKSALAGALWPAVLALVSCWIILAGLVKVRDYLVSKWRQK